MPAETIAGVSRHNCESAVTIGWSKTPGECSGGPVSIRIARDYGDTGDSIVMDLGLDEARALSKVLAKAARTAVLA